MIEHLFQALRPAFRRVVRHPLPILLAALALAAVGLFFAAKLRIDPDFARLIPPDYPSVQALETLRETVGGESDVAVVIESPSFEANKRFAEALIPRALALRGSGRAEPYFTYVAYRKDVTFLQENALYFATDAELDSLERFLEDKIEAAYLAANPFYFELEDEDERAVDTTAEALAAAYDRLVGKEYPISDDSLTMALRFYPSGAQTDIAFIEAAYHDLEALVAAMEPDAFHPEMEITLAGRLLRQLIEIQTVVEDVGTSFGAGVLTLLLMVVAYFFYKGYQTRVGRHFSARVLFSELARTPVTALILGVPLVASLAWTFGVAYLLYGTLNMMTSTLGLLLFGMGIDFGIHFYARYAEERRAGRAPVEAAERTFLTTGQAVAVVALTTAAAFYLLMIADFRGFSQFGAIAGTGLLFALIAMTVVLPALIAFFERVRLLNLDPQTEVFGAGARAHRGAGNDSGRERPRAARARFPAAKPILALSILAVGLSLFALPEISFEYYFGRLTPEYEAYNVLQRKARRVYSDSQTRNAAYIIVDDPAEAPAVAAALRAHAAEDTLTPTIRAVETFQDRFPTTPAAQVDKLERIARIRTLLDDPLLQASSSTSLERLRRATGTRAPLSLRDVPAFLKEPFTSKQGEIGQLVLIYPSVGLSDGRKSIQFSDDVGTVVTAEGRVYHAGSTSLVAADMLRLMRRETPVIIALTLLFIVGFKAVILRRLRWVLLALLPLAASFLWMFGLMVLFGLKLNFYNLVVLPTVLGIGDDSGIHLVHRYLEEGKGSIRRVLRSTGEHITMSALTTMVGFGGLLISFYPGLRSIGQLAVLGIGMTLLAALLFLPALIQWLEDRTPSSAPRECLETPA